MRSELPIASTAQQEAYLFIRNRIMSGAYPGGFRVNPAKVADRLGLSRMPVREAILQLDAEGFVTIRPNRGAVVTTLTPDDVEELFEMRAALEGLAVVRAMPHLVGDAAEELLQLKTRMDRSRGDTKLWLARHSEFHDFLAQQSGRPRLAAEIRRIRSAVQPYLQVYISVYASTEMEGYEHQTLLDAIRTGNSHLVERTARDHVLSAGRGVIEFLRSKGPAPARDTEMVDA